MLNNNKLANTIVITSARPPQIQRAIEYPIIRPDMNANNPKKMYTNNNTNPIDLICSAVWLIALPMTGSYLS